MCIVGSFASPHIRADGDGDGDGDGDVVRSYDEQYVCVSYCEAPQPGLPPPPPLMAHAFPPAETVSATPMSARRVVRKRGGDEGGVRYAWEAEDVGRFTVDGDLAVVDMRLPNMRLVVNVDGQCVPWGRRGDRRRGGGARAKRRWRGEHDGARDDGDGGGGRWWRRLRGWRQARRRRVSSWDRAPEGWLGKTGLLPCHYAVHSLGSDATYHVELLDDGSGSTPARTDADADTDTDTGTDTGTDTDGGTGSPSALNSAGASDPDIPATPLRVWEGAGQAHLEANFGVAFPEGWCWVNAIGPPVATASEAEGALSTPRLTLTGGRFQIGPFSPR